MPREKEEPRVLFTITRSGEYAPGPGFIVESEIGNPVNNNLIII